jgi:integrase
MSSYLYQRPGSKNWYLKLQTPGNRREFSLGTPDKRQAEINAAPYILEHKKQLLERKPRLEAAGWQHRFEPGREHTGPKGERIFATDRELFFLDQNGVTIEKRDNGGPALRLVGGPLTVRNLAEAYLNCDDESLGGPSGYSRPKVAVKDGDDKYIEDYVKDKEITGRFEHEVRGVWSLYKSLIGKPLIDADRNDGRKLVDHFKAQELASATIRKKLMWLCAAVNHAIETDKGCKLKFNPFSGLVSAKRAKDAVRREPLEDADIAACKAQIGKLKGTDALLFRLLATTGMRLAEAFEIDREKMEGGVRYVTVGSKTETSLRYVPLPADVLPYLPEKISGRLFAGTPNSASKRLNKFLRDCGIEATYTDTHGNEFQKCIHSLRHRAATRLRAAACPEDIRWALLGHEKVTVARDYGRGHPVPMLREWIDRIGF